MSRIKDLPNGATPAEDARIAHDHATNGSLSTLISDFRTALLNATARATLGIGLFAFKASVNFNSANNDNAFAITLPTGYTRYVVESVRISGASASITTATAGVFTATAGGGTAIVTAASAITVSTASEGTNNNSQSMTVANAATQSYTSATLYFRTATAQGSAATGTVTITIRPLS